MPFGYASAEKRGAPKREGASCWYVIEMAYGEEKLEKPSPRLTVPCRRRAKVGQRSYATKPGA